MKKLTVFGIQQDKKNSVSHFLISEFQRFLLNILHNNVCLISFCSICLFSRSSSDFNGVMVFKRLIGYVSQMLLLATINHKHNALLESCILDFLDRVSVNSNLRHGGVKGRISGQFICSGYSLKCHRVNLNKYPHYRNHTFDDTCFSVTHQHSHMIQFIP